MSQQHAMSAHTRYRATFVHPGVMNRSLLAHAVHPVWVTIRVQVVQVGDTVCMEWCSGSAMHQLQCRKSHPTFLHGATAEREGRTETTPVLL